jgi:ribonuclease HI
MTKQLAWIDHTDHSPLTSNVLHLYIDGASRGNPGPAGIGIYLTRNSKPLLREGFFIGSCTNNQAEYIALLVGVCHTRMLIQPHEQLTITSDSELLVNQLHKRYRVQNPILKELNAKAHELLEGISYTARHVLRAYNDVADALANEGIDKLQHLPETVKRACGLRDEWLCL